MPIVVRRIRLEAPPARVWPYLADLDLQLRWMRDLKSIELETPGPIGAGARAVGYVRVFGIPARDPVEVDAFVPERHLGLRHRGLFTGRGDLWLAPDGSGSLLTWREEIRFASRSIPSLPLPERAREMFFRIVEVLGGAVDPLLAPVLAYVFRSDLRRLRRLLRSGDGSGPAEFSGPIDATRGGPPASW